MISSIVTVVVRHAKEVDRVLKHTKISVGKSTRDLQVRLKVQVKLAELQIVLRMPGMECGGQSEGVRGRIDTGQGRVTGHDCGLAAPVVEEQPPDAHQEDGTTSLLSSDEPGISIMSCSTPKSV